IIIFPSVCTVITLGLKEYERIFIPFVPKVVSNEPSKFILSKKDVNSEPPTIICPFGNWPAECKYSVMFVIGIYIKRSMTTFQLDPIAVSKFPGVSILQYALLE